MCNCNKTKAIINGFGRLATDKLKITNTKKMALDRLRICNACSHMKNNHCELCSCYIAAKIRQDWEKCPLRKW